MNEAQINGYFALAAIAVNVLGATVDQAKNLVAKVKAELHPDMTDDELNGILEKVADDALRRKALADADVVAAEALVDQANTPPKS